jgi:DNA-binding transcriptional LysR family regulator
MYAANPLPDASRGSGRPPADGVQPGERVFRQLQLGRSLGVVFLFEDRLRPFLDEGPLVPVLEPWWQSFSGPFLYFPSRRLLPAPLRAFVDFIRRRETDIAPSLAP